MSDATFFDCSRSGKTGVGHMRTDRGPQHTHYIPQLIASWSNFSPRVIFFIFFGKNASCPRWEAHFCRSTHRILYKKYHFFGTPAEGKTTNYLTLFASVAPLSVRFGFLPLHGPLEKPTLARRPCLFHLPVPKWKNNHMHYDIQLVNCSFNLLFFFASPALSTLFYNSSAIS